MTLMPEPGKTSKLRGLLLKKTDFGEGHSVYTALCAEHGRAEFLTFGSRRENSARRAGLLVTNLVNAVLARKSEDAEWTLREISVEKSYPGILSSLTRTAYCHLTLEILDQTVARGVSFPLFGRLTEVMDRLESHPDPAKFAIAFLLVLFREEGILPDAAALEDTDNRYPGLCPAEFRLGNGSRRFILDAFRSPPDDFPEGRTLTAAVTANLVEYIRHVCRYHSGRDLKSVSLFPGHSGC